MVLEKIKSGLKKRKVKVFLIILLFSTLAWFINNLSFSYNNDTSFELEYVNTPEELLLTNEPQKFIDIKLKALGFQFLGFELNKKKVLIDLSKMKRKDSTYYISPDLYRKQIENQLPNSMTLLEIDEDTLFFDFTSLITKEVPVIPRLNFSLASNFMLDNAIKTSPSVITLKGPKNEIDTIKSVRTAYLELLNVDRDFSKNVSLIKPRELATTVFSPRTVSISGNIFRFSERIIEVPVKFINLPDGVKARTFPDKVQVLCQGKLENIKAVEDNDFEVVADYERVSGAENNMLSIELKEYPIDINKARLLVDEIEFILRRK